MIRTLSLLAVAAALALPAATSAQTVDPLAAKGRWTAQHRGAAPLPPMGWNSWNAFTSDIDEEKLLASAKVIVDSGLAAKGYRYIDIDDGWWLRRNQPDGRMVIRTKAFPSAAMADGTTSFRPLTDRLHAMGLKAGIYSDIGRNSCGQVFTSTFPGQPEGTVLEREVGLFGHVDQDIRLYFADWGFDLIKVDGCGIRGLPASDSRVKAGQYRAFEPLVDVDSLGRTNVAAVRRLYEEVGAALDRWNPDQDFVFSLCIWGAADVRSWAKQVGNMSRTSEDISPSWGRMLHNLDSAARRPFYAHPGSWNDPDMLFVGTGPFDADHPVEARAHFSLWAMLNAPLMIGYDLRKASPALLDILGNARIIALNQDPAGNQAILAVDSDDIDIFVKTLANGDKAVAIFNRTDLPLDATLTAQHLKLRGDAEIALTDLWSGESLRFTGEKPFRLAAHEARVFTARGARMLADGLYLSEMPGRVNPAVDGVIVPQAEPLVRRSLLPWRGSKGNGEPPRYGGWGGTQPDRAVYGETLGVGGRSFETGVGALANSRIEVRSEGFARFSAEVGVDDSARDRGQAVTFYVYADGKLRAQSPALRFGQAPVMLKADIRGAKLVELVARTPGNPRFADPIAWGNAALHR
ncbi:NPCBM/NEW2 domain-containing protein [Sphingomonas sp. HT-1]|uniref:NPCBM/NEW2 domain-containing protein n=1 Tax=unclassified Sphingomonas TaxID=196159 RepID=UPI0002ED48DC|nr:MULTISPECIES: NPCBM/NEW2 domain-containing protein [unclassified Sphingomonas]KTF69670.1 alpha-galactosidase [Sphingomonas sp. WG]